MLPHFDMLLPLASGPVIAVFAASSILLISWRLIRFTIISFFYPNDPKEYPHWIPVLGHLYSFFQDSCGLLSDARLYFNDSREPFALTVAGQKWYILTSLEDVNTAYKINDGSLSYDIFAMEVMRMIGITEDGIQKAVLTSDNHEPHGPGGKHLVALCKELQLVQLLPGNKLDELLSPEIQYIQNQLQLRNILETGRLTPVGVEKTPVVSLYQFISEIFIGFGQEAYYEKSLSKVEPHMHLLQEDTGSKEQNAVCIQKLLHATGRVSSDAAWMILELESCMKKLEVCDSDMALFFFQLYWSITGSIKKAPFWMLSYMLFDEELIEQVPEETRPAFSESIDVDYLLNSCPLLTSIWDETTRLTAFAASVRFLTQDSVINGKIFRKGNRIMMPQRQLHFNTDVFGSDATSFTAQRFSNNHKLKRNGSFRPFGGGTTLCPGRYLAKQTSLVFVALLLHRFNITLDPPGQRFPLPTEGNPSIGLVDVVQGTDLKVRLSARVESDAKEC